MAHENKTNVCRILDKAKIAYSTREYQVDENDLSAVHVAESLGEDIATVFKTLILHGAKGGYFVCVIPGAESVDLKKAAAVRGEKKVATIPMKELLPVTGYIRGGCSPIGLKKAFPVVIDESCMAHEKIYISAGMRGMQVQLAPPDLIKLVKATVAPITLETE